MPRVSVVTPVYNGAAFIANNIRSVMAQTFTDWEHIIVDDCSTDDTCDIIREFPHVKLIQLETNGGPARALNHGYRAATGEYFAWVSADDGYMPTYMEKAATYLDAHPEAVCVDAGVYFVDADGYVLLERKSEERTAIRPNDLLRFNPIHGSSTMFRSDIYRRLNGFNEDLIGTPDTDMWIRMCEVGAIGHIAEAVTFCTRHPNQDSRKRSHLVTQNQLWLADEAVKRFGIEALIPSGWQGPREGAEVEAAGWFALALAKAGTSDNELAVEWIERARKLAPSNLRYRLALSIVPRAGSIKFKLRGKIAPFAVKAKASQARKAGRNVHTMNQEWLAGHPFPAESVSGLAIA
jgi:glycosyltransferase involved in cell wall biosynthesis